ncbi:MAG: hypothetical protein Q9201_004540 [Fulgogasparrea decipioides]
MAASEAAGARAQLGGFEGKQVFIPSGLETTPHEGKEVYRDDGGEKVPCGVVSHPSVIVAGHSPINAEKPKIRRKHCITVAVVVIIIVTAICVPVGVVVSRNKSHHESDSDSASNKNSSNATLESPSITSKSSDSVLKGTRLVTMDPRTGGDIYLYYQEDDGGLHYISQSPQRIWQGSAKLNVPDARLGTPLGSISTVTNGSTFWWLFYIDNADVIQNIYSEKDPTTWHKGSVGNKGFKVPNNTNIAFTVSRGRKYNKTLNDLDGGMSLYATDTNGTMQEYIFDDRDGSWNDGFAFPDTDGFAGAST